MLVVFIILICSIFFLKRCVSINEFDNKVLLNQKIDFMVKATYNKQNSYFLKFKVKKDRLL